MNNRIWIPIAAVIITTLVLQNAMSSKPKVLIVAIGDSLTAGTPFFHSPLEVGSEGEGDPEGQYLYWMMQKRPQWNILNHGIAGQTSSEIRLRLRDALRLHPRYVIILAGTNDIFAGSTALNVSKELRTMYLEAQAENVMPVAATIPPFDKATRKQARSIEVLNDWIRRTSDVMRLPLADFNAVTRDPKNPDRLKDSPDGLHPDVGGYRAMGMAAMEALDPIEKAWR